MAALEMAQVVLEKMVISSRKELVEMTASISLPSISHGMSLIIMAI